MSVCEIIWRKCHTLQGERGEGLRRNLEKLGGNALHRLTVAMTIAEADEKRGMDRAPIQLPSTGNPAGARWPMQSRGVVSCCQIEGVQKRCKSFACSNDALAAHRVPVSFGRIDGGMFCCNVHRGVVGGWRQVLASPTHSCAAHVVPSLRPLGTISCRLLPKRRRCLARLALCAMFSRTA